MNAISTAVGKLYKASALRRVIVIWIAFQVILWAAFAISYSFSSEAWQTVLPSEGAAQPTAGIVGSALFIFVSNLFLLIIIGLGNLFVRFGAVTPGSLILLIQGIVIGITAGTNAFEFPFASVLEANIQYLKVGLWETTSYALICAVTLNKSLNIAETFPARQWSETRKIKDLRLDSAEKALTALSIVMLIAAAIVEAVLISG